LANNLNTFDSERRIAMLIDGDNAGHSSLKQIIEEVSRYGDVTVRRAYGDWTQPDLANWRPVMLAHAIQPIQQWRYTTGKNATKNATDSALIIDAMDILYSGTVQGFCVVSSDSDYTRLCTRIRESGLFVMGIGRATTPESLVKACNVFVYVENLIPPDEMKEPDAINTTAAPKTAAEPKTPAEPKAVVEPKSPTVSKAPAEAKTPAKDKPVTTTTTPASSRKKLLNLLRRAFDLTAQDDQVWVDLGALGNVLRRLEPSFDSRTYGFKSLTLLITSMPEHIEVKNANKSGTSARMKAAK